MKQITLKEWIEKGEILFGKDRTKWKFVCPKCKTVQTLQDIIDTGVSIEDAQGYFAYSCIGRFTKEKGCNWTLGGLLQIHTTEVIMPDGKKRPVFEFAE